MELVQLPTDTPPTATRKDSQLGRRLFHMVNGLAATLAYGFLFTHAQAVHLLGTIACIIYISDKVRIAYPNLARRVQGITNLFLRAEERLAESSMIPYVIALLLTIISFPKPVALIAILTLAIADPLSALVGINFGKRHWVREKTVEGSAAFFSATLLITLMMLLRVVHADFLPALGVSFFLALSVSIFEMLPLKLDDNLTIPLFVGFAGWAFCALFGVPV